MKMAKRISFLISNPNHHVKITLPVAERLKFLGYEVVFVSICQFRRLPSPKKELSDIGIPMIEIENPLFKNLKTSSGAKSLGGGKSFIRSIVQFSIWLLFVRRKMIRELKESDLICTCNDYAAPFLYISAFLNRKKIPFVCLQEGIRFHQPGDDRVYYGTFGSDYLIAWGQNSVDHFLPVVQTKTKVVALGTPIYDRIVLDPQEKLDVIQNQLSKAKDKVIFLSNPVEDIGFCTKSEKLELFRMLLKSLKPQFKNGLYLLLRVHPRENIEEFMTIAQDLDLEEFVINTQALKSIFSALSLADRAIVMASTAGVDALIANRPLAILKVYENDFGHDYVQEGAASPLILNDSFDSLFAAFLEQEELSNASLAYRDKNMINIGRAAEEISNFISKEVLT